MRPGNGKRGKYLSLHSAEVILAIATGCERRDRESRLLERISSQSERFCLRGEMVVL